MAEIRQNVAAIKVSVIGLDQGVLGGVVSATTTAKGSNTVNQK